VSGWLRVGPFSGRIAGVGSPSPALLRGGPEVTATAPAGFTLSPVALSCWKPLHLDGLITCPGAWWRRGVGRGVSRRRMLSRSKPISFQARVHGGAELGLGSPRKAHNRVSTASPHRDCWRNALDVRYVAADAVAARLALEQGVIGRSERDVESVRHTLLSEGARRRQPLREVAGVAGGESGCARIPLRPS